MIRASIKVKLSIHLRRCLWLFELVGNVARYGKSTLAGRFLFPSTSTLQKSRPGKNRKLVFQQKIFFKGIPQKTRLHVPGDSCFTPFVRGIWNEEINLGSLALSNQLKGGQQTENQANPNWRYAHAGPIAKDTKPKELVFLRVGQQTFRRLGVNS